MTTYDSDPMQASSGDRKPTSWTARILAPVLLVVVAAAIVLIVSGTLESDDGSSDDAPKHAATSGGCQPPDDIKDAVKDGYYVVQEGDNFTTIAEQDLRLGGSAAAAQPEPRPVRAPGPELRRPGRRRMQGARRRLTPPARAPRDRPRPARARCARRAAPRRRPTPPSGLPGARLGPGRRRRRRGARGPPGEELVLDRLDDEADDRLRRPARARPARGGRRAAVRRAARRVAARPRGGGADRGPRPALRAAAGLRQRRRRGPRPGRGRVGGRSSSRR